MSSYKQNFPFTDWATLRALRNPDENAHEDYNGLIAGTYWRPLHDFLLRKGHNPEDAADLVQEFLAHALRTGLFAKARQESGRFRNFLLASLIHFAENDRRKQNAAKRKPAGGFARWQEAINEYYHPSALIKAETPEERYQQQWVAAILNRVIKIARQECEASRREVQFTVFEHWILKPELEGTTPPPLLSLAEKHGLSAKAASNAIVSIKRVFRRLLRQEVRSYALTDSDARGDEADVLALLSMSPRK